jgi:hypothetical protein
MIKSPIKLSAEDRKCLRIENKIKEVFKEEGGTNGALIFFLTKNNVVTIHFGLCGHQLLTLSKQIKEMADKDLEKHDR